MSMVSTNTVTLKTTPKDFFMHLLMMITLYMSTISFITLIFEYIDHGFPDLLDQVFLQYKTQDLRWYIAMLTINFPVYLYAMIAITKQCRLFPEKNNLHIRKCLIYFTLFLAALIIMGDLGALLYYFLSGELTLRFLFKVLVLLIFIAVIFYYYLRDLKQKWTASQSNTALCLTCLIVIATLGYGVFLTGSPFKARDMNFDKRRLGDLNIIQQQIINYWVRKNTLPKTLENLTDAISGFKAMRDPQTGAGYMYEILTPLSFKLCANFSLASLPPPPPINNIMVVPGVTTFYPAPNRAAGTLENWNWQHTAGNSCFVRTIDPQLYNKKLIRGS